MGGNGVCGLDGPARPRPCFLGLSRGGQAIQAYTGELGKGGKKDRFNSKDSEGSDLKGSIYGNAGGPLTPAGDHLCADDDSPGDLKIFTDFNCGSTTV